MPTTIGNIAINVSDLERSERFYVDVLGLEVINRIETADVKETFVGSTAGGSQLALAQHADGRAVEAGGGMWKIYVAADDADRAFRRAVEHGAEPVAEPRHLERVKVTIAFVRDPDGHLVELGQQHP